MGKKGKLAKAMEAFVAIVKQPSLLNLVLNDNEAWKQKTPFVYQNGFPVVELDDLIPGFAESLTTVAFLDGGSMLTDLALLKALCRQKENCSYFEIGTWRGESVVNVSEVATECYTLGLPKDKILALGMSERYANAHQFFSKNKSNIIHIEADSTSFDFASLNKKFDVIFIDGSHHYDDVVTDTRNVFAHLVHDDSVVVWHDYAYSPEKLRFETLNAILSGTSSDKHGMLYQPANTMCAIYTKGRFLVREYSEFSDPVRKFEVNLKSDKI